MKPSLRIGITLFVGLLSLGAGEVWHRQQEGTVIFPWDEPGRGFATQPGTRGTNSWGFYEREIPPGRDASVHRVAVLGDSMTWGTGTAAQAWPRVAETGMGEGWQFLNFAHYGYDLEASRATWHYHASQWQPDWVIYAAYTNDLVRNSLIYLGDSDYPVWIGSLPGLLPPFVRQHSALARRLEGAWIARTLQETVDLDAFRGQLAGLKAEVEQAHARLVVAGLLPQVFAGRGCEVEADFCALHLQRAELQRQMAEALALPYIDGRRIWAEAPEEDYYPKDPQDREHPNPEGQAVLGRGIARAFRELATAPAPTSAP